ncbi:hypothetical protein HHI36_020414 [Cryptolaemus montrouzieri]|uniref:Neuropeptide-like 4 n=1 Tax=Cryptolaemus montrouzieri TaxID=559131 RepID=A0ABD2NA60_9CUCU
MFAKIILIAFALFAVALAAPEARPQYIVPGATAYTAYSAPVVGAYPGYSAPYAAYSGIYPSVYGGYHGAVVV